MLRWIRNLHTCKTESCCWHGGVWPVLGPSPPHMQQEKHRVGAVSSLSSTPTSLTGGQHPVALSWAGTAGAAPVGALARGTHHLRVGCDPDPLGGCGQLCCLLQDFREGQEIVEEQEPFAL